MTHTEAILAQIQEHLGLPPIPLTTLAAVAPTSPKVSPTAASADPALEASVVPPATLAALPADHP